MKPTTTTVKVCSAELDDSRSKESVTDAAKRVSDGSVLRLLKAWLRAPMVEEDRDTGRRKVTANRCGTPQGGVI